MDQQVKAEFEARAQKVRADLKQWEADWVKSNGGKKPGREDIKNNPKIAQKYKDYNKLRDIIAGKVAPPPADAAKSNPQPAKRKSDVAPTETPMKRAKHAETPSKHHITADEELMNSPAISRKLFSPAPVTSIGPTPQRDGKVLGLFDLLVEKELGTPSKGVGDAGTAEGRPAVTNATPSKRRGSIGDDGIAKLGRTPSSASKRKLFMTPRKNKEGQGQTGTPTSISKLQFDTPAFLKRHSLPTLDEDSTFDAPPLRLPRKPLVRGLSEIVASLRRVEEDQLDDDLEALREVENGEFTSSKPVSKPQPKDTILEPDSQAGQLPLGGFDDEGRYDSPVEEDIGRDGQPLRVFKKKGQKRTTRLVKMRPTRTQRPTNLTEGPGSGDEDDGTIPETQAGASKSDIADGYDGDFIGEDDDTPQRNETKGAPKPPVQGVVKKAARKFNELAHANFQRLKLKNYGAKGGPGYNSRFRRRR